MSRSKVFISYSHSSDDKSIAKEIVLRLKSKLSRGRVFFDKRSISKGDAWEKVIEREVPLTRVAVFLISPDFLASSFIEKELRSLTEAKKRDPSVRILWVCLKASKVPVKLLEFQGYCLDTPLTALDEAERQRTLERVAQSISDEFKNETDLSEEFTERVRRLVRKNFDLRLDNKIGYGDHSIIYKASSDEGEYAVKARVGRVFEKHLNNIGDDLQRQLEHCQGLYKKNPVFIPLRGGLVSGDLQILISEFVQGFTPLRKILCKDKKSFSKKIGPDVARFIVGQLASALADYHSFVEQPYGVIRPSDVLVDEVTWKVRLPSFRMAILEYEQSKDTEKIMLSSEVLSYLSPEQHEKLKLSNQSDQCSLGILAVELVVGKPPVTVSSLDDLRTAREFFETADLPRVAWEKLSNETGSILKKMISKDPSDRYPCMREVAAKLGVLENIDEDNRRIAKKSYVEIENTRHEVIESFYDAFFEDPEVKKMFAREGFSRKEQHKKLEQALLFLLNFSKRDRNSEPTTLTNIRKTHDAKSLKGKHFKFFKRCLLDAIKSTGQQSEEVRIAWEKTMQPSLDYMARN